MRALVLGFGLLFAAPAHAGLISSAYVALTDSVARNAWEGMSSSGLLELAARLAADVEGPLVIAIVDGSFRAPADSALVSIGEHVLFLHVPGPRPIDYEASGEAAASALLLDGRIVDQGDGWVLGMSSSATPRPQR